MRQDIQNTSDEIHSSATIKGHPIHPMAIPFPIASLVGVFVCDLVYLLTQDSFWLTAAWWLLMAGLVTGIGAAIFGLVDFLLNSRIRRIRSAWIHAGGNLLVIFLVLVNLLLRSQNSLDNNLLPWGIVLSFAIVVLLVITGWHGGEMVFRHKVGVDSRDADERQASQNPDAPAPRLSTQPDTSDLS